MSVPFVYLSQSFNYRIEMQQNTPASLHHRVPYLVLRGVRASTAETRPRRGREIQQRRPFDIGFVYGLTCSQAYLWCEYLHSFFIRTIL